jgi:hypothetical protein
MERSLEPSIERLIIHGKLKFFMLFEISIFFDKETLLITIGFDLILASSLTGAEVISNSLFASMIFNSRGIVIALRHASVGTTFAYNQLLIQPKNNLRFPVLDHITPAYSSGP